MQLAAEHHRAGWTVSSPKDISLAASYPWVRLVKTGFTLITQSKRELYVQNFVHAIGVAFLSADLNLDLNSIFNLHCNANNPRIEMDG